MAAYSKNLELMELFLISNLFIHPNSLSLHMLTLINPRGLTIGHRKENINLCEPL